MERRALAARPQPCPICGVVLAGEELLRHAETCRGFSDSEEASDESSSDESFAEPITIWTETSPDPRTPLVVTFINKPRPKPIRMRPPPLRGTPWPASRPLDPTASLTTLPRTSYAMRVEARPLQAAQRALVAARAADARIQQVPEANLIYTTRDGEPDLRKTREWQRVVAEEARLLASFGGARPSSAKRQTPPPRQKPKRARAENALHRLASRGPKPGPARLKRLARATYDAGPAPAKPTDVRDYIRRMQQVHKLAAGTIATFAGLLKHYQSKRPFLRQRDGQVLAIFNLLKGFPDLVNDFYQFLPEEDRERARRVVADEVRRLAGQAPLAVEAPGASVPTQAFRAGDDLCVGWRLEPTSTGSPAFLAGRSLKIVPRPGFRLPPPVNVGAAAPTAPVVPAAAPLLKVAPPRDPGVRDALDALRSHLARFCQNAHSVDPRDRSIAEDVGALERVAARFGVKASSTHFAKVSDVVARCAVRVATNGGAGDLEGLAGALRALAFDAATARVFDAVLAVLPDASKVLGAIAKLEPLGATPGV